MRVGQRWRQRASGMIVEVTMVSVHPDAPLTVVDAKTREVRTVRPRVLESDFDKLSDPMDIESLGICHYCRKPCTLEKDRRPIVYGDGRYWHRVCYPKTKTSWLWKKEQAEAEGRTGA